MYFINIKTILYNELIFYEQMVLFFFLKRNGCMTKLPMFSTTKLKTGWRFEDQFREQIENTFF